MRKKDIAYLENFRTVRRFMNITLNKIKDDSTIEDIAVILLLVDRIINRIESHEFKLFSASELKRMEKVADEPQEENNERENL